jgi:hypothetical protein
MCLKYSNVYLTIAVPSVKMTRMITRRWLLGCVMALAGVVPAAAQPVTGPTLRWQIEAGG